MKKQKVEKLIAKAVAKAEKRVEYELELVGERQHAQSMSLRALEQAFKEQQEAAQQKEQPRVPLNPSDWYPKPTVVPINSKRNRVKQVQFKLPARLGTQRFVATSEDLTKLAIAGIPIEYTYSRRDNLFRTYLPPFRTSGDVGKMTKQVNEIFKGRLSFYAEVRSVD